MRLSLTVLLATFWVSCTTTPPPPPEEPPPPPPPPPAASPLSPEAAAVFARAEAPGPGAALVINLDALEALGFESRGFTMQQLAGVATAVMSQLAAREGSEAQVFARGAVAGALLREWAKWPNARRIALLVPSDSFLARGPGVLPQVAVGALAVDEGAQDNAQLLSGLVALVRAAAEDLTRQGTQVRVSLRGNDLCVEGAEVGMALCIRPQRGLMLFGTPTALAAFEALPAVVAPAPKVAEAPVLVGLRLDMGSKGRGSLALTGRDAVRLALHLEGVAAKDVRTIDAVVKKALSDYDAHQAEVRQRLATGLAEVQRALIQDAGAPASLQQASSELTAERVVDEKGYWSQMRQSLQVSATQDSFSLSLSVPAGAVKEVSELSSGGGTPVALMGIAAAVAIPNFMKFQTRSKQAEAQALLKAAFNGQRAYFLEKGRWGRSFEEIGFSPEPGRRYTYCMGKQCLPCDKEGCKVAPPPSPCQGLTSVGKGSRGGFSLCAYGNLDSDDTWDVWVIDQKGKPENLSNDLE